MAARLPRARALHCFLKGAAAIGLGLVFVVATAFALVVHVDQPAVRRIAASTLTGLLSEVFAGTLTIGAIDHISPTSVDARDITVKDPTGRTVLEVSRLRAQADVFDVVYKILWGDAKTTLIIDHARVERAEALIVPNPNTGIPTLADAFTPREIALRPGEVRTEGRYLRVWLPVVEVGMVWRRGLGLPQAARDFIGVAQSQRTPRHRI